MSLGAPNVGWGVSKEGVEEQLGRWAKAPSYQDVWTQQAKGVSATPLQEGDLGGAEAWDEVERTGGSAMCPGQPAREQEQRPERQVHWSCGIAKPGPRARL